MKHPILLFCAIALSLFLASFTKPIPISWPLVFENETVTQHLAYSTLYNHSAHQPLWVAYTITPESITGSAERTNKFMKDPAISPSTCVSGDYAKSGFDRGHLAPAADMKFSQEAMKESFYMSNICPQRPGLNRLIWKSLETQVRNWAKMSKSIFVVAGPIFAKDIPHETIGKKNKIFVPEYFFKALLDTNGSDRMIGFIFKNSSSNLSISEHAVSIDKIEEYIGRDLFPQLPVKLQEKLESRVNIDSWFKP
jgi:endonuclease G